MSGSNTQGTGGAGTGSGSGGSGGTNSGGGGGTRPTKLGLSALAFFLERFLAKREIEGRAA